MDDETITVMMIMMVMMMDDEILLVEPYTGVMLYQLIMLWSVLKAKPKSTFLSKPTAKVARVHTYDPYKDKITWHD